MIERLNWVEYFLLQAQIAKTRSTCLRRQAAAVFVVNNSIAATGYNGSISGAPHCDELDNCSPDNDIHCPNTIHAEPNGIGQAARYGRALDGGTGFLTMSPCFTCFKLCVNTGIQALYYPDNGLYFDGRTFQEAKRLSYPLLAVQTSPLYERISQAITLAQAA